MITVQHLSGVGVNSYYAVLRDGIKVASISRYGQTSCRMCSVHYSEPLGQYVSVNRARAVAASFDFPTAWQVYETICQRTEDQRRRWKERELHTTMVVLIRELAAGSNSAHDRMVEMVADIEAFAKDRTDTTRCWQLPDGSWCSSSQPIYPVTPDAKEAAA